MPSVLVTGAGRGIGEAIALRLARAGWTVFAGVREELTGEGLGREDRGITRVLLDITNEAHVAALADNLPDRLDALVNNAGIGVLGPIETVSVPDLRRQFEVNLFGQVAVTQAVLPQIRAGGGRIVFISSTGGRAPVPMEGAYISGMLKLVSTLQARTVPPDVVARVVEQALTARRPRARYAAGAQARAMVTMNAVLPTRLNDAIGARLLGLR